MTAILLSALLVSVVLRVTQQSAAAVRFDNRSLYINSSLPGVTTFYRITFTYPTVNNIGSLRFLVCKEAIPQLPCEVPEGFDWSNAALTDQSGETGFSIHTLTQNELILTRLPDPTSLVESSYRLDNVVNPSGDPAEFFIRMTSHASTDGTGPLVDFGSIAATTTMALGFATQVPPKLTFCIAASIPNEDCSVLEGGNVADIGVLSPDYTSYATSEMLLYTNASNGLALVMAGHKMTSGIQVLEDEGLPAAPSTPGVPQFRINLTANTVPPAGADPVGSGTNLVLNNDYTQPDIFLFNSGDVLATSDDVTMARKLTTTYIVNVPDDQPAGVYSTTVSYICTAAF